MADRIDTESGENYPKSFDEAGSVKSALSILEKYL